MPGRGIPLPERRIGQAVFSQTITIDTATDSLFSSPFRGYVFSVVSAPTGTGTLDPVLQGSPDGNAWYDLHAFPQVGSSSRHDFKVMDRNIQKLLRVLLKTAGASPQFDVSVWAIPKNNHSEPRDYHDRPLLG